MMHLRALALLVMLAMLLPAQTEPTVVQGRIGSDKEPNYLNAFIRHADEASYGLNKLNPTERGRWNGLFQSILARLEDNLRNSASRYLSRQGWGEVKVTGTEMLALGTSRDSMQYLVAEMSGVRYALEPRYVAALAAGTYWGKQDSTGFRIIDPTGATVEFTVRQTGPTNQQR